MMWHKPKMAFIHIPKTGGSSVEHLLYRCQSFSDREGKVGQHSTMADAYKYMKGSPEEYFKFTIVRNTWDRIISFYLMHYKRNSFSFPNVDIFKGRHYVSFSDFYRNLEPTWQHAETVKHYLEVDGQIPDDLHILRFDHLEADFVNMFEVQGIEMPMEFPHVNKNERASDNLRAYLKADPEFADRIAELYADEIDHFNFEYSTPHQ